MPHRRIAGLLLVAGAIAACSPGGNLFPSPARTQVFDVPQVLRVGDTFDVYNTSDVRPATLWIMPSGKEAPYSTATIAPGTKVTRLPVDAATFPGLDLAAADALQSYELRIRTEGATAVVSRTVEVLADPAALLFPDTVVYEDASVSVPPGGKGRWEPAASDGQVRQLIDGVKAKLGPGPLTETSMAVTAAQVPGREAWPDLPADTPMTRYTLTGPMPRMLVPAAFTATKRREIFAPASVSMVIARTARAAMVSLQVAR